MMEDHEFCDHCPGCRPAMLDQRTGRVVPPTDPLMVKVNKVWDENTTYEQRKAYIEVTLHNSRDQRNLRLARQVVDMIQEALR